MSAGSSNRRVMWLDDDRRLFDIVSAQWPRSCGYTLEWTHHARSLRSGIGTEYEAVLNKPPYVLVFDWDDGAFSDLYRVLKDYLPQAVLISSSGADVLAELGVFRTWPEFVGRSLQKPFTAEQLLSLLPTAPELLDVAETPPALPANLPLRFLDSQLLPRRTNAWWRTSLNRPDSNFPNKVRRALANQSWATYLDYGADPADPSRFGLLQFTTYRLDEPLADGCVYAQHVALLPPELSPWNEHDVFAYGTTVEGVLALMRQLGFPRGRYYHLSEVPGLRRPLLELMVREPDEQDLWPLPAAAEMDEQECAQFEEHRLAYIRDGRQDEALMSVRQVVPTNDQGNDAAVWAHYVRTDGVSERLEVPLFSGKPGRLRLNDSLARHMVGMMVFDLGPGGGKIDESALKRVRGSLRAALRYLAMTRTTAMAREEQHQAAELQHIQHQLAACVTIEELEHAVVEAAVHLAGDGPQRPAGSPASQHELKCSAIFARFDEWAQKLLVTADSSGTLIGASFTLDQIKFFAVQAAVSAQEAMNSNRRAAIEPVFVPDVHDHFKRNPAIAITAADWSAACRNATVSAERAEEELKRIATVVALAVTDDRRLLGVLVVRSDRAYGFVNRRVQGLQSLAELVRPFLAQQNAAQELRDRSTLVLHELRSHLTRVRNRIIDGKVRPADDASRQALSDAEFIAQSGTGLADLYLGIEGFDERKDEVLDVVSLWQTVDSLGQVCARDHLRLGWRLSLPRQADIHVVPRRIDLLLRVMNVLVDNAFRHAQVPDGAQVVCTVREIAEYEAIEISLENPGRMRADARRRPGSPLKGHVGLTLAERTCSSVGASLQFDDVAAVSETDASTLPRVRATLRWPLEWRLR